MSFRDLSDFLQRITSFYPKLSIPRDAVMRTILAIVMIGFIWASFSEAQAGRGGIEAEVGDVPGNGNEPYEGTTNLPFLQHVTQSPNSKQDEMEKSRLKALDEKLRKAEEEGNRAPSEGSGTGSVTSSPSIDAGGAKP